MSNVAKLEALKQAVEALWSALQDAPETERPQIREKYRQAYESYRRQRIWVAELGIQVA